MVPAGPEKGGIRKKAIYLIKPQLDR